MVQAHVELFGDGVPQIPPSEDKSTCRRLWNDGFQVMTKPFALAVVPLITITLSTLFVLFLLIVLRRYMRRQRESPSPSRKIYHVFVWILALVNIVRSITNILHDNYPWSNMVIVVIEACSSSVILAIESSVVIFVLHAHMQVWSQLLKRVTIITVAIFCLYSIAQVPLIWFNRDWITKWGYYSLYNYWIGINAAWALVYLILISFKVIGCQKVRMPRRPIFTVYMVFMLLLHMTLVADCIGIFYFGVLNLYCVSSIILLMHYVLIGPLLYYAFLWDFVFPPPKDSPFSELYYAQGDDLYYSLGSSSINDISAQSQWLLNTPNRTTMWPHD